MSAKHALIVDDSKSARTVLAQTLEQYAIEVDMAESAEEALEYLKTQRPDAIFMDHQMPGMDGLQAVRIIKNDPRTATIPIIMYTSQEGELYVGQARARCRRRAAQEGRSDRGIEGALPAAPRAGSARSAAERAAAGPAAGRCGVRPWTRRRSRSCRRAAATRLGWTGPPVG